MTAVGCPLDQSAIYKIEKSKPRRRIVVDELVAFSRVFDLPVADLLLPPGIAAQEQLAELFITWSTASDEAGNAEQRRLEAWTALHDYVSQHPDLIANAEQIVGIWADFHVEDEQRRPEAIAYWLYKLTDDVGRFETWMRMAQPGVLEEREDARAALAELRAQAGAEAQSSVGAGDGDG